MHKTHSWLANGHKRHFRPLGVRGPSRLTPPATVAEAGFLHNRQVNIQLLSDLHLESNPHFPARPAPGADLLVLAGDIGSYQPGSLLTELHDGDFGLARLSPPPGARGGG